MSKCEHTECTMPNDCAVLGCIFSNQLLQDKEAIQKQLLLIDESKRLGYVVDLLQKIQPPKVSGRQIAKYNEKQLDKLYKKKNKPAKLDRYLTAHDPDFHEKE